MFYFWGGVARCADDGDDIKAMSRGDMLILQVMVNGGQKIALLLAVYGCDRCGVVVATACLHFNEYRNAVVQGNDVDVAMARVPVSL